MHIYKMSSFQDSFSRFAALNGVANLVPLVATLGAARFGPRAVSGVAAAVAVSQLYFFQTKTYRREIVNDSVSIYRKINEKPFNRQHSQRLKPIRKFIIDGPVPSLESPMKFEDCNSVKFFLRLHYGADALVTAIQASTGVRLARVGTRNSMLLYAFLMLAVYPLFKEVLMAIPQMSIGFVLNDYLEEGEIRWKMPYMLPFSGRL